MFSWIEPRYGDSEGMPGLIDGRKHFILSGDVSDESDIDGTVTFTNLTVIGSTSETAYLLFSVDGVVTAWTMKYNPQNVEFPVPPTGIMPHFFFPNTIQITEVTAPSSSI